MYTTRGNNFNYSNILEGTALRDAVFNGVKMMLRQTIVTVEANENVVKVSFYPATNPKTKTDAALFRDVVNDKN